MNIDKFGHHVHKRLRFSEILDYKENSLVKSENGTYDLQASRLTGVREPTSPDDVVNKKYVDEKLLNLCSKEELLVLLKSIKADIADKFRQFETKFGNKNFTVQKQNDKAPDSKRNA